MAFRKVAQNMVKAAFILSRKLFTRSDMWCWHDAWSLKRRNQFSGGVNKLDTHIFFVSLFYHILLRNITGENYVNKTITPFKREL